MVAEKITQKKAIFLEYYQSDRFKSELKLPNKPNFHHFRFERFSERRVFKRLRDVVKDKETLINAVLRECPKNIFFSPLKWLDPVNVRRKTDKEIKDYMLSSPLYFDVDKELVPRHTLDATLENTQRLINYIENKTGRKPDWIVFSGSEGFHIYYWNWDDIPQQYDSADERIKAFIRSRKQILVELYKKEIMADGSVTADPWRILRVPGTLHGDTGLIAKALNKLDDFSIEKTMFKSKVEKLGEKE